MVGKPQFTHGRQYSRRRGRTAGRARTHYRWGIAQTLLRSLAWANGRCGDRGFGSSARRRLTLHRHVDLLAVFGWRWMVLLPLSRVVALGSVVAARERRRLSASVCERSPARAPHLDRSVTRRQTGPRQHPEEFRREIAQHTSRPHRAGLDGVPTGSGCAGENGWTWRNLDQRGWVVVPVPGPNLLITLRLGDSMRLIASISCASGEHSQADVSCR